MQDTWAFGFTFSVFHLFFGLGIAWVHALSFLPGLCPLPSYVYRLLSWWFCMPLHCSCYIIVSFLFPCYLWAYGLGFTSQNSCCVSPLSTSLPLLSFIGPHSYRASPFHSSGFLSPIHSSNFLSTITSSLPLLLPWVFAKSFGLLWPNYHILTSY